MTITVKMESFAERLKMKVNKKTFLPSFLSSLCLAFVSCTVKPPELIVKGVKADQALSSLETYRNNEAGQRDFSQYTRYLRDNHTLRFHWDQYWSGIKQQQLYKDIKPQDLDKLLSLNQISCKREHREAFFDLLLQIAAEEPDFLPFSRELARLQDTCSIRLSHSSFKAIVLFLSGKRDELEAPELAREKSAWQNIQKTNSSTGKISPSGGKTTLKKQVGKTGPANAQSVLSGSGGKAVKESESKRSKYIYTQELQKVVVEEWLRKPNFQKWKDILEPVDRDFWSDARWVNYQSKDREYLRGALEMEKNLYPSPIPGLDRDIFMMFGEKGKMADIIKAANYEKYFSAPGALDWTALWTETLLRYPEKPENGNTDSLLSLYAYSSCQGPELSAYLKLTDSWQLPNYKSLAVMFCRNLRQQAVRDTYDPGEIKKMFKEFYDNALNVFIKRAEEDVKRTEYEVLDEALSAPPKKEVFAGISVITQKPGARTVREMTSLLSTYKTERRFHSKQKWRVLLEKHFLERDWLNLMSLSRRWGDRSNIEAVLNMHHDLYNGQISFLAKDVEAVLNSEWLSPSELSKKYGYPEVYLEGASAGALFFQGLKDSLEEDQGALVKVLPIYRDQKSSSEEERLKKSLQIFSEGDWLNLTDVLRKRGDRSNIEAVLNMHHDLYDGQVSFLAKDVEAVLNSEWLSPSELSKKYGYPETYLEGASVSALFFQSLKADLKEDPGALVKVLPIYREQQSPSEKKRLKDSLQIFSEGDWLNLTAVLRKRGDRDKIEAVLNMHRDLHGGPVSFLAKDVEAVLNSEWLSPAELSKEYGYPEIYLESVGSGKLFLQILKADLKEDPGALVKVLSIYREQQSSSEKERLKDSLQIFSEEDWLNLTAVLRERKDHANIEAVLNMHHDLYDGQISFLAKDMTTALGTEGISLEDLTEKYGYPKAYLESAGSGKLFLQILKADLKEDQGALVKVLSIYREQQSSSEKERLKDSLQMFLGEEDWLNLMRVLRERKDHANIEAVLNMHHDLYDGQISFLAKDMTTALGTEGISLEDLTEKYGYPKAYLESAGSGKLFLQILKADLKEDQGALVKVLSIYREQQSSSEKERLKDSLQIFSEEDWLNLMAVLRERKDHANIEAVLNMHHDLYDGQISFLAKDVTTALGTEGISLEDLTEKYGYPKAYLESAGSGALFFQGLKADLKEDSGALVKILSVYEKARYSNSEKARLKDSLQIFSEEDWLNLTAVLRERGDRDNIEAVLNMHHALYGGQIAFLAKDVTTALGTEGISLEDLTEKYGYPKVYLESAGSGKLFLQILKADLKEDPGALVKVLSIYREQQSSSKKARLKDSLQIFSEEDWLNLTADLRKRGDRANIKAVLNMHHDLYGGQIPFLVKDVKAVLNSEWLSPTEVSRKYGYPETYLEEWSVNVLFFQSLTADLEEDPGALVKILLVYEKARHTHSEKERLKISLQMFLDEKDWLNLMRVLRERKDLSNIEAVLDMHHDLYDRQIPFLAKDMEAILLSKKFSLSGLTDQYGYKAVYINKQEVRSQFWQQVSDSMDEDESFSRQTAFQEGVEGCDYPYIRDLHFFFSEMSREDILIDQFRFNDCADFIKKFRDKEWDRLTALVQRGAGPLKERAGSDFVWWLARVLSLYSGEEDLVVKEAVSQIGVSEYRDIVTDMMASYAEKKPETETYLFQETLKKIEQVYGKEVDTALCSFFVEEENSSLFIQERGPEQLMDFLRDLSWVKIPHARMRRGKKICAELVPEKRRNALLYELAQSLLDKQSLEGQNLSLSDSIVEIWSVTDQIVSLSVHINSLEKSDIWSLSLKALFKSRSEMSDYDFYLRFSKLTLERLIAVAKHDEVLLLNHLKDGVWSEKPPTAYHAVYRDWIENALAHGLHPSSGAIYVPLPPFGLNKKKKPALNGFQRVPSVFLGGLEKSDAGRSLKNPSAVSGFKKKISSLEKVFHRVSKPSVGALSADVSGAPGQPAGWRETGALRKIQSEPAPDDAKVDYEQIFLEETADSYDLDYEISGFGGMAVWGNPYISSRFVGLEVKKQVQSLLYLGLEYSHYKSKISSTMSAFENLYGVDVSYPLVKDALYIKGYYKLFKSHLNLAGVFKIKLDVPLQIGVGVVNTENIKTKKRNKHLSLQWGAGPRIQWGPRWGTQLLLSQSVSAEKFDFLHTWCSLVLVFGF